ncbi:FkbM family methyltransferase [Prosthecobacter fluviatilis]|uniref:FkbM family methyltransferase n=1 Tax=Prosthecobacter fluviatilis TaxID=445931 RepID=A0ABW0KT14_9BACT
MNLIKRLFKQLAPPILQSWITKAVRHFRLRWHSASPDTQAKRLQVAHNRLNSNLAYGEFVLREGMHFYLHPESFEPFEAFCYVYPEMVEEMDSFLALTKDRLNLLDVGALHGVFSLAFTASSPDKKAVAVDASPFAFARLLYNVHKNAPGQVIPVECALSDESALLQMHYEWEHAVVASMSSGNSTTFSVPAERGDEVCSKLSFKPDVVKIDVEGHEISVLKGLSSVIETYKPLIFLEYHPQRVAQEGRLVADLISLLDLWGYCVLQKDGSLMPPSILERFSTDQRIILKEF